MCQSTQTKSTPLLQGNGVLNPILKMEALRRKLQATSAYSGAFILPGVQTKGYSLWDILSGHDSLWELFLGHSLWDILSGHDPLFVAKENFLNSTQQQPHLASLSQATQPHTGSLQMTSFKAEAPINPEVINSSQPQQTLSLHQRHSFMTHSSSNIGY